MADNELIYKGKTITALRSAKATLSESLSLSSLPVDTLQAVVVDESLNELPLETEGLLLTSNGVPFYTRLKEKGLDDYEYGEPVLYRYRDSIFGKFYLENIKQVGKIDWQFNCVSAVGLLLTSTHYGGIYTGQKAKEVIAEIVNDIFPYTLESTLEDVEVYGWLPKASRRDNLRDVLFAIGGTIRKDTSGEIVILPYTDEVSYSLSQGNFYRDGGSVNYGNPATQAIITEHNFAARDTDEVITLFEGEALGDTIVTPLGKTVDGIIVDFTEPMHSLEVSGTTILESGVNYAVIGLSAYAVLTGKVYTHTQRAVIRNSDKKGIPNVVSVSKCYLANIRNSNSIADRVMAFYGYSNRVTTDMVLTTQKPGDYVNFKDPYGRKAFGYIESIEASMSKYIKARTNIVTGFVPPKDTPMSLHYQFFFFDSVFTVPEGVTQLRVVLIGGGPGGYSGGRGKDAKIGNRFTQSDRTWNVSRVVYDYGIAGDGGDAGPGGEGAKVYTFVVTVTSGQQFNIKIGKGGTGGIPSGEIPVIGKTGTATTFGEYSSDSGTTVLNGYLEEVTGETYAGNGASGQPGGKGYGGDPETDSYDSAGKIIAGDIIDYNGLISSPGQYQTMEQYSSGSSGSGTPSNPQIGVAFQYGLGGGPAVGANGGSTVNNDGAKGATPTIVPEPQTKPGYGGNGGHGGGGGGAGGLRSAYAFISGSEGQVPSTPSLSAATPGLGGEGGQGGVGGPGAVFVYYYSPEE